MRYPPVFLADMGDFASFNEVYVDVSRVSINALADLSIPQFLPQPMPARSCLQAIAPGKGTVIEIEAVAIA